MYRLTAFASSSAYSLNHDGKSPRSKSRAALLSTSPVPSTATAFSMKLGGGEDLSDAATLCATEMLANVHRHAGSPECELTLDRLPGAGEGVRLAVSDQCGALPTPSAPQPWTETGRGLLLLAATAERWGTDLTPTGKQVWAVLR
ncbi:ATP-binding protein [Actinacidiphila soli]|uniref:ATP-binding protein n=1 Tax=Actinacidiphila soli TaxID=2487275 RepID=UPI00389923AC